jgi:hypothetical protein
MKCSFCGISLTIFEVDTFEDECDQCRNETQEEYYERLYQLDCDQISLKDD